MRMHGEVAPVSDRSEAVDLRCRCGRLMARYVPHAIELKCPRCKRMVVLVDGRPYFPEDRDCEDDDCLCGRSPRAALRGP